MTEYQEAIFYANKILDRINADPDDDQAVVARQFIRATERLDEIRDLAGNFGSGADEALTAIGEMASVGLPVALSRF